MSETKKGWAKITVDLLTRQIAQLDRLSVDIRLRHRVAISRAAIIRALIEAAARTNGIPEGVSSPDER